MQLNKGSRGFGRKGEIMDAIEKIPDVAGAAAKVDRYRVHRGEPGGNAVIDLREGQPVMENPPLALASPLSSSLPLIIQDRIEGKPVILSAHDEKAYHRFALIKALWEEISQNVGVKKHKIIKKFLKEYNSKSSLPNIFDKLKRVSRPTMYRWIKAYKEGGIDALVPEYRGPEPSEITLAEKEFLLHKLLDQNKPTIGDAINKCKFFLGEMSPSGPSKLRRWIYDFKKNNYDIWVLEREGEKALNDKCVPYAERDWRKLTVGDGVVADGHKLNFLVINPFTGKPTRAVMVLFWDWKSSYPLGWEIMVTENIQCVLAALRNSIISLGKFPKNVLLDNGKAFRAKVFTKKIRFQETEIPGIFEKLGIVPHFAIPYNAQSKPIERIFKDFNDFEREMPSYVGSSILDKPAYMGRNEKRAKALHDDRIPTIQEATELIFRWREYHADQRLKARDYLRPKDLFEAERGPGVDPFVLHFLMMSCKARMVHRNGITFNGWHWYHEKLYGLKDYVLMFYSYYDLSQVYIFTVENDSPKEFLCAAKPVEKVNPFAVDSECPEDMAAVQRINALKRKAINMSKKLADVIQSQKNLSIDWDRVHRDRPEFAEGIKQIEEKNPKLVRISPFNEGIDYGSKPNLNPSGRQNLIEAKMQGTGIITAFIDGIEYSDGSYPLPSEKQDLIEAKKEETKIITSCIDESAEENLSFEKSDGKAIIVDLRTGLSCPADGTSFRDPE
jgi:putative transposase